MSFSGLKLDFKEDGDVSVKAGEKEMPHRVDLIEEAFDKKDYDAVIEMLFNFNVKNCINASKREHIDREVAISEKIIKLLEEA